MTPEDMRQQQHDRQHWADFVVGRAATLTRCYGRCHDEAQRAWDGWRMVSGSFDDYLKWSNRASMFLAYHNKLIRRAVSGHYPF